MKRSEYQELQRVAARLAKKALPWIRAQDIEIAGFGMDDGVHRLGLVNVFNETFCGKILISPPGWICPMHHHKSETGKKDEGFLVVYGTLLVTTPPEIPGQKGKIVKVGTGKTLYLPAGTVHGLSAGRNGAVYLEFSERDQRIDIFPFDKVTRDPAIEEDVPGYQPPPEGFPIMGNIGIRL